MLVTPPLQVVIAVLAAHGGIQPGEPRWAPAVRLGRNYSLRISNLAIRGAAHLVQGSNGAAIRFG